MVQRKKMVTLRLFESEYDVLKKSAASCELSMEQYLRNVIMEVPIRETPPIDYRLFIRELNAIGNNINQIAYAANISGNIHYEEYMGYVKDVAHIIRSIQSQVEG